MSSIPHPDPNRKQVFAAIRARLGWTRGDLTGLASRHETTTAGLCVAGRALRNLEEIAQLLDEIEGRRRAAQ